MTLDVDDGSAEVDENRMKELMQPGNSAKGRAAPSRSRSKSAEEMLNDVSAAMAKLDTMSENSIKLGRRGEDQRRRSRELEMKVFGMHGGARHRRACACSLAVILFSAVRRPGSCGCLVLGRPR